MSTGLRPVCDFFFGRDTLWEMRIIRLAAPAKLNVHLAVGNRRPDGCHDLESIFIALDFGDTLRLELAGGDGEIEVYMRGTFEPIPLEENIVYKAICLFRKHTGFTGGIRALVEKRIPAGGGLGGGSSDAAAVLAALNTLSGGLADPKKLAALGALLGSDVPFFLEKAPAAWVSGRGEHIRPITAFKRLYFTLVNPGFPSGTAAAFRLLDEYRDNSGLRGIPRPGETDCIAALSGHPRNWPFANDFLPVFGGDAGNKAVPGAVYRDMLAQLRNAGAVFAGLSGSGSTCFGVFLEREAAETAAQALSRQWPFVQTAGIASA